VLLVAKAVRRPVDDLFCAEEAIDPFGLRSWEQNGHVQHIRIKACAYVNENLLGLPKSVGAFCLYERLEGLEREIFIWPCSGAYSEMAGIFQSFG
jgi:hypothetical protein